MSGLSLDEAVAQVESDEQPQVAFARLYPDHISQGAFRRFHDAVCSVPEELISAIMETRHMAFEEAYRHVVGDAPTVHEFCVAVDAARRNAVEATDESEDE